MVMTHSKRIITNELHWLKYLLVWFPSKESMIFALERLCLLLQYQFLKSNETMCLDFWNLEFTAYKESLCIMRLFEHPKKVG